jgi:hypothetical protein
LKSQQEKTGEYQPNDSAGISQGVQKRDPGVQKKGEKPRFDFGLPSSYDHLPHLGNISHFAETVEIIEMYCIQASTVNTIFQGTIIFTLVIRVYLIAIMFK